MSVEEQSLFSLQMINKMKAGTFLWQPFYFYQKKIDASAIPVITPNAIP